MPDRTIHAKHGDEELVRYDRAGKWYVEFSPPQGRPCRKVRFSDAVTIALRMWEEGGSIYFHRPGGNRFDKAVQAIVPKPTISGL